MQGMGMQSAGGHGHGSSSAVSISSFRRQWPNQSQGQRAIMQGDRGAEQHEGWLAGAAARGGNGGVSFLFR